MSLPTRTNIIILKSALATAAAGIFGAFGGAHVDVPAIVAIWAVLLCALADDAGVALQKDKAVKIATVVATGLGIALVGVKTANMAFAYTGIGTIPAIAINSSLNAVTTFLFGRASAETMRIENSMDSWEKFAKTVLAIIFAAFGITSPWKPDDNLSA